jgi:hypothetical protein
MAGKAAGKDSASWSNWSSSMPGKGRREGSTRVSKRSTPAIGRDGQVNSSSTTKLPRKYAARQRPEDTSDVGKPLDAREARALREKQEHNAMKGKATKGSPDKGQGSKPRGPRKP